MTHEMKYFKPLIIKAYRLQLMKIIIQYLKILEYYTIPVKSIYNTEMSTFRKICSFTRAPNTWSSLHKTLIYIRCILEV